ncbi:MAG: tetratricopeptide repeat protein [Phycisphaerae bacterium]|nr:tetratricopeptide repeat protein [Gemmatimonadaceae bacterium]
MTLDDAAPPQTPHTLAPSEHGLWKERNAAGLSLAARGAWAEATEAFTQALAYVDALTANDGVTLAARDSARAKVLLNLAQSQFHLHAYAEARRFAERSLAIRVGLYGEDSLVVARTRSDLAVILGVMGERDEASSLLDRAVSAVERRPGEQSAQLIPVLSSAVRIIASGTEADANTELVEARIEALAKRQESAATNGVFVPTAVPAHSFQNTALASGSDDQPLRAAIAETANLLRTTPASNVAVNINLDDAVFDLIEPPPATLSALPAPSANSASTIALGFEVRHGIPTPLHVPLQSSETMEIPLLASLPSEELPEVPAAPRTVSRAPVRAVGGIRSGRTQVATPKLLRYIGFMLLAFAAGVAMTLFVWPLLR